MASKILITGACGYIGSHSVCEFINTSNAEVLTLDNLSNSKLETLKCVEKLTDKNIDFFKIDIRDEKALDDLFLSYDIDAVVHFAGLKAVGESCEKPLEYYDNNFCGTKNLINVMAKHNVKKFIFSSSATVYGAPKSLPIKEDFPLSATNPYGRSKLMIEELLRDLVVADKLTHEKNPWKIVILRYFNPIGAHSSGLIGEDPTGIPNNLLPYVAQVAAGKLPYLSVFGDDYNTSDGTGVRDYIHVVDLAKGHVKSLDYLNSLERGGCEIFNLGAGKGYSVLEIVEAFKRITNRDIPYEISKRRQGDIDKCYADVALANRKLNWHAEFDLEKMIEDAWRWQMKGSF
ncbi:MAG: UDP-glucose 4-epimerase GalE [Bdellovibrionota bacterium]